MAMPHVPGSSHASRNAEVAVLGMRESANSRAMRSAAGANVRDSLRISGRARVSSRSWISFGAMKSR